MFQLRKTSLTFSNTLWSLLLLYFIYSSNICISIAILFGSICLFVSLEDFSPSISLSLLAIVASTSILMVEQFFYLTVVFPNCHQVCPAEVLNAEITCSKAPLTEVYFGRKGIVMLVSPLSPTPIGCLIPSLVDNTCKPSLWLTN